MTEKMMHVGCLVPLSRLWELLMALEAAKVGNVEVRPVVSEVNMEMPKKPMKQKLDGRGRMPVTKMVSTAMVKGRTWKISEMARALGVKSSSVCTAMNALVKRGEVIKKDYGLYQRVKEVE